MFLPCFWCMRCGDNWRHGCLILVAIPQLIGLYDGDCDEKSGREYNATHWLIIFIFSRVCALKLPIVVVDRFMVMRFWFRQPARLQTIEHRWVLRALKPCVMIP